MRLGPDCSDDALVEIKSNETVYRASNSLMLQTVHRVRQYDGSWTAWRQWDTLQVGKVAGDVAHVLPYDPMQDKFLLIEQFRIAPMLFGNARPWLLEQPAGLVDAGETAEAAARRELLEETGCAAKRLEQYLTCYPTPGFVKERFNFFIAEIDCPAEASVHGLVEETENIRTHIIGVQDAIDLLDSGKLENGPLMLALNWFARHHASLRERWLAV